MKKALIILSMCLFSLPSVAQRSWVQVEIVGPCSSKPILATMIKVSPDTSVYDLSKEVLDAARVSYIDDGRGFVQIANSPRGDDALIIFGKNNERMRAYGWCYAINGEIPMSFANEISIGENIERVTWFYAYSELYRDKWLSMCIPSYQWVNEPPSFCF